MPRLFCTEPDQGKDWMNVEHRPLRILLGLLLAVSGAGCAMVDDTHEDHWRTLVVTNIVGRAELPANVDAHCVNPSTASESDSIVVVQYRIGRAPHRHAFVLRAEDQVNVGDRVAVNPRLCALRVAGRR